MSRAHCRPKKRVYLDRLADHRDINAGKVSGISAAYEAQRATVGRRVFNCAPQFGAGKRVVPILVNTHVRA